MTGDIALTVALAFHANALLLGRDVSGFSGSSSAAKFCKQIRFFAVSKSPWQRLFRRSIAQNPEEWFAWLVNENAKGVGLQIQYAPVSGKVASPLFIPQQYKVRMNVAKRQGTEFWQSRWEYAPGLLGKGRNEDRKPWKVTYQECEANSNIPPLYCDLYESYKALERALDTIYAFALSRQMGYAPLFLSIMDALREESDKRMENQYWPTDLVPEGMLKSWPMLLLRASQSAWVFTGMGSWADNIPKPEDETLFVEVTEGLFLAVMNAICAVVNSTCPAIEATSSHQLR